jgi:hypothetical protein
MGDAALHDLPGIEGVGVEEGRQRDAEHFGAVELPARALVTSSSRAGSLGPQPPGPQPQPPAHSLWQLSSTVAPYDRSEDMGLALWCSSCRREMRQGPLPELLISP